MRRILVLVGLSLLIIFGYYAFRLEKSIAPDSRQTKQPQVKLPGAPSLTTEQVIDGLSNVWDVAFTPSGTMLITERSGEISKITDGKKKVLLEVEDVFVRGEGGLLGMTVDPDFATNRYVYACYNTASDIRVSRWKMDQAESELQEQTEILTGLPANTSTFPGRHSGCRPRFGADGNLWLGTGDAAIGTNSQNPKSLGGKVLRMTRDGRSVAGNMTEPFDPRIYSYGHRNVQGLAMLATPVGNIYGYSVEHGPERDDEVNFLANGNFGWDPVPGYNESVDMTDTKKYPEAIPPLWKSGSPTIAPSGATLLTGQNWKDWEGSIVLAAQKGQHIRILQLTENGTIKQEFKVLDTFGRLRSVVMGPNNDLYFTTDNGSGKDSVVRVIAK